MKIGVCGTGTIASWVSDIISQLNDPEIVLYTCVSPRGSDVSKFAEKYGYRKTSASVDELMADPEVDLVYVAVPNNLHYAMCMKAIENGKHVVCEKPFSVRKEECAKVQNAAREKGVFLSEALWHLFLPAHRFINDQIASGRIGEVRSGEIVMLDDVTFLERVKKLETGGGVLLDEGPYTFGFMVSHFGTDVDCIESKTRKLETGVDAEDEITVHYRGGAVVRVHQRMDTPHEEHAQYAEIIGTKGKIRTDAIANPNVVEIYDEDGKLTETWRAPEQIIFRGMPPVSGYEHEWIAFAKALRDGKQECPEASQAMTLLISDVMDQVLQKANIRFPF